MMKTTPLIIGLMFGLIGCSQSKSNTVDFRDVPVTEIVATHAIETQEAVRDLTFVPNDVAPWLGRLVTLHPSGALYSTDIEGRNPDKTGNNSYASIHGLNREKSAGVFLATNSEGKLEAFVENNDEGQFGSMQVSGAGIDIASYCKSDNPLEIAAPYLDSEGHLSAVTFQIRSADGEQSSGLEYQSGENANKQAPSDMCSASGDTTVLVRNDGDQSSLHIGGNETWTSSTFPNVISSIAPVTLNDRASSLIVTEGKIYLFDNESNKVTNQIVVNSGLSIMGVETPDMVSTSQSNFGGGAFAKGLVAFGEKDTNRIVFISLEYLETVLSEQSQ